MSSLRHDRPRLTRARTVRRSLYFAGWIACQVLVLARVSTADQPAERREEPPLRIVVMDPLALPLSCACVPGVGQKDYDRWVKALKTRLGRTVDVCYAESLASAYRRDSREFDLIIGPQSVVLYDAESTQTPVRPLLALTDRRGSQQVRGAVLVRQTDPALRLEDLAGRTLALGPIEWQECHTAVRELVGQRLPEHPPQLRTCDSIDEGVFALLDREADAAVVPEYLPELLIGCQKAPPGSIRVLAFTAPVPFLQAFGTERLRPEEEAALHQALIELSAQVELLAALESQSGFVEVHALAAPLNDSTSTGWSDWRGPRRDGISPDVPRMLTDPLVLLWRAPVTGPAMAGLAATQTQVVVADKDAALTTDIFRSFDAATGRPLWTHESPAAEEFDYTNAPRATPVVAAGMVYLQGTSGHLHCLRLDTGEVVWERHLAADFGAEPPTWGYSVPPLLVDEKLVVLPGGPTAGIAALDAQTGEVLWQTPGHAAAYAPLIAGTWGGRRQIIGYDSAGLAGWDIDTGVRLWELVPPGQADFNVGTPVAVADGILVATENNATRQYRFHADGTINPVPAAVNEDLAPDTCTPVVVGETVFCTAYGELYCLDLARGLETNWSRQDDRFFDHTNLIAGNGRVLMWTTSCDLLLLDAEGVDYRELAYIRPLPAADATSMSHPALVGDRLYLRDGQTLACFQIGSEAVRPAQ